MYGQTEATARIAYRRADLPPDKPGSVGRAVPGGRLLLRDDRGAPVTDPGATGRLWYEGPNVMLGYAACRADLAAGDVRRGLLETGDLASLDADGDLFIRGRGSRFVKMAGLRIDLDEVEDALRAQGLDCACGGGDDRLAVAVADPAQALPVKRLLRRTFRIDPTHVQVVEAGPLPRTAAGKIAYTHVFGEG
jgi:acyl-coenzyme A synthetase/AMP-(fatty) acid ligase